MSFVTVFGSVFVAALAAGSILPMQSEAVLAAMLLTSDHAPWLLVLTASTGNILGSVINWLLGRGIERFRDRRWFPVGPVMLERAQRWYQRFGKWSLLLSFVPIIGDPLTVMAGVMRERLAIFVAFVAVAKTARYVMVAAAAMGLA